MNNSVFWERQQRECARWKRKAEQLEEVLAVGGMGRLLDLIARLSGELKYREFDNEYGCLSCDAAHGSHEPTCSLSTALNEAAELVTNNDDH